MRFPGVRRATLLAAVVGSIAALGGAASSASAAIVKLANGETFSTMPLRGAVQPFDTRFDNLDYNGGPVMPSNTNYLIFWSPGGLSAYPSEYPTGLETYLKDLAHDSGGHQNVDSSSAQYNDSTGNFAAYKSTYGGVFVDTDAYPASKCPVKAPTTHCLVDTQLQDELAKFTAAHKLPRDLKHEYFLLSPPHVENCFDANVNDPQGPYGGCSAGESANPAYCAYHGNYRTSPLFIYSNDPYVTGNGGCDDGNHPNGPSDGALEGGFSHEHNESITDPLPNSAWTDIIGSPGENGDKCAGTMGASLGTHNGASYNQLINGHFYWYQEEWSNQSHHCVQRFTLAGAEPVPHATVTAGTGNKLTFDASTSTGTIADYSWQFNDGPGLNTPIERTTPTVARTYPAKGVYVLGLTTYLSNGTSRGAGMLVSPGRSGAVAGITVTPASPTHGTAASLTSPITQIAGQAVLAYSWDFGDGTVAGAGKTVSHTFATAGPYRIRLTMLSNGGSDITTRTVTVQ